MQYKRKKLNLGVKKKFQMWLLVRILGTVVLSSVIAAGVLYFYAHKETADSFYDAHIKIRRVSDLLLPVIAAGSLVSLISGSILAIFLPQKIAGPIYRIEQDLKAVQDGDLTTVVRIRNEDVLKDLQDTINLTIASLRAKVGEIKDSQGELERSITAGEKNEVARTVKRQKECLSRIIT